MYIEIHNLDIKQEALYFKLNSAFSLDTIDGKSEKIKGIYAIYKDNICLYVGQSKNIASRIATHLSGKYKEFTNVYIWDVREIGFSDFIDRSSKSQKEILDNCEQFLMTKLQPIENILIDMSKKIPKDQQPLICFESCSDITIQNNDDYLIATNSYSNIVVEIECGIDRLNYFKKIDNDTHSKIRKSISNIDIKSFIDQGIKNET